MAGRRNALILDSLEALQNALNALKSEISDEEIAKIIPLARQLLKGTRKNVFWSEVVSPAIFEGYRAVIASVPTEGGVSTVKAFAVLPPVFVRKEGEAVFFDTRVQVAVEATTAVFSSNVVPSGTVTSFTTTSTGIVLRELGRGEVGGDSPGESFTYSTTGSPGKSWRYSSTAPLESFTLTSPSTSDFTISGASNHLGFHTFVVHWHATYSATGDLTMPELDGVEHEDTEWDNS
jgi:hypothetical protein